MAKPVDDDASTRPATKKPYTTPELHVYGTVAAMTATLSMAGQLKDGGPNNLKT